MDFTLKVWRQEGPLKPGKMVSYKVENVSSDASFLEMLDILNEDLILKGDEPVAFDHDCREGICGACGSVVNGHAHGHQSGTTLCQLHMREFKNIKVINIEPWRAAAFPIVKDLIVDRSSFDDIIASGGYVSIRTGAAPDANALPVSKEKAELAMDAAACIGCGACVAACPNGSAMLFTAAKISQMAALPQGQAERTGRAINMVRTMEAAGFGACTNHGECEAACPKEISVDNIAVLNRDFIFASLKSDK